MVSKTELARQYLKEGKLVKCFKILKTFRMGIKKEESAIITRAYELMIDESPLLRQLGFDQIEETVKAEQVAVKLLGIE